MFGPSPRVTGSDESYLLAEDLFGMAAPMQFAWVFDDDPGEAAIEMLGARLAQGPLHRAVRRTRIPAARHAWVRSTQPPQVFVDNEIDDDAIGEWTEAAVRRSDLAPTEGRGWRLETTTTTVGRRVVSLAVSHMIADGAGPDRSAFLSSFFTLVGTHGLHVTFGLIWMVVLAFQVMGVNGLNQRSITRLACLSLFWHFLDVIWML